MKKIQLLLILTFFITTIYSQSIFIGTKSYPATDTWAFLKSGKYEGFMVYSVADICFAKASSGGYLMISTETVTSDESINGNILIYLTNGKAFALSNRIFNDYSDNKAISIYSVSSSQISMLETSDISKIRYSIVSNYNKEGFTAENRHNISQQPGVYDEATYNTAQKIKELFNL